MAIVLNLASSMAPMYKSILGYLFIVTCISGQDISSSQTCVHTCLNRFTSMADKIMAGSNDGNAASVSWQNLLHVSNDGRKPKTAQEMRKSFDQMCISYKTMRRCVEHCRDVWLRESVISGFASIKYVCEDRYQEFITHLPCLATNERRVVERCSRETNQTAAAISALERTVFRSDIGQMTETLAALCRNTSQIVDCLTPATEEMCGKRPATILRKLVTLGFKSIEQMYTRLKIENNLPNECANLARAFLEEDSEDTIAPIVGKFKTGPLQKMQTPSTVPLISKDVMESEMKMDDSNTHLDAHSQIGSTNSGSYTRDHYSIPIIIIYILSVGLVIK